MLLQTVDYVLHCPLCKENCAHALYIYQFDPSSDDCCYFSCVGCISKLRTKVGVPAACWERWDESKVAKHSERSWYPCTSNTQAIMETVKSTKKRKRKAIKKPKKTSTAAETDAGDTGELVEKIYLYIASIEMKVRAIKRLLVNFAADTSENS